MICEKVGIWVKMRLKNFFQHKIEVNEDSIREELVSIREVTVDGEVRIFKEKFFRVLN